MERFELDKDGFIRKQVERANIVDDDVSYLRRRSSGFMRIPDEVYA